MDEQIAALVKQLPSPAGAFDYKAFVEQGNDIVIELLNQYLQQAGAQPHETVSAAIRAAATIPNADTDARFWRALSLVVDHSSSALPALRFTTLVEQLQGYRGATVFPLFKIQKKRRARFFFAYFLVLEHLRYLCGHDDDFSPSDDVLTQYQQAEDSCCDDNGCCDH